MVDLQCRTDFCNTVIPFYVCVCVCVFFFTFFSTAVYHRWLDIVPCAGHQNLVYPSHSQVCIFSPPPPSPFLSSTIPSGKCSSVLYVCESTSASWRSSFVSWFRFYLKAVSHGIYLSLSDLLCWGWSFNLIHFNETNESVDLTLVIGGQQGPNPYVWRVLIVWIIISTVIRNKWETESEMSQH